MKKIFYIRKTQEDLLREQQELVSKLLANQAALQNPPPIVVHVQSPFESYPKDTGEPKQAALAVKEEIMDFSFDEPEMPFIPKVVTDGKASLERLASETSDFDPAKVEKLKRVKKGGEA